ncbi:MAG: hypothetical protein ACI90U_001601 [Pseudomonadales bacterium]
MYRGAENMSAEKFTLPPLIALPKASPPMNDGLRRFTLQMMQLRHFLTALKIDQNSTKNLFCIKA